jgi:5'-deoxynucleotidase YfbR-like HD superfamily hydrolase
MTLKDWIELNFKEPLKSEKLKELEQILKQIEIQNCKHEKFYFDIDKMEDICQSCKKTKLYINSRNNEM